jgi:hypothetical protein
LLGRIQAIQVRHGNVEDDHIRLQRYRRFHQAAAIGFHPDHLIFRLQETPAGLRLQAMIVRQQQSSTRLALHIHGTRPTRMEFVARDTTASAAHPDYCNPRT